MKKGVVVLSLLFSISLVPAYSATPPKAGSICTKLGITKTHQGKKFTCVKSGKKLVWSKSVVGMKASPVPKPVPTPVPTPTNSIAPLIPTQVINLNTSWTNVSDKPSFILRFDFDFSKPENANVNGFAFQLYSSRGEKASLLVESKAVNRTSILQELELTYSKNTQVFGIFETKFSKVEIYSILSNGSFGSMSTFESLTPYQNNLPAPTISVSVGRLSFKVEANILSSQQISIEEVVSNSDIPPASGWVQVYLGRDNPVNILTPTSEIRWIRARYVASTGTYGPYSQPVKVRINP